MKKKEVRVYTRMDEKEYLQERLEKQMKWYSRKTGILKKAYNTFKVFEILFAGSIPVVVAGRVPEAAIIAAILGALAAVVSSLNSVFRFQERWINYRFALESIKQEKYLFLTETEPYHQKNRFALFVVRCESLISKETASWGQYSSQKVAVSGNTQKSKPGK